MIIPKLFILDHDPSNPETGNEFLRPATTEDITQLVDEYYEALSSLNFVRQAGK